MKPTHTNHIDIWQRVFETYTQRAFKNRVFMAKQVAPHLPSLYRRFANTALMPGNYVTPAALMQRDGDAACVLLHTPRLQTVSNDDGSKTPLIEYTTIWHTIEDHPVYSDIKILQNLFSIPRDFDTLAQWADAAILSQFSICDIAYFDFLVRAAIGLKLLVPFPSLYAFMLQTAPGEQTAWFDALPPAKKLERLASAVMDECAAHLSVLMPATIVSAQELESVLLDPLRFESLRDNVFAAFSDHMHTLAEELPANQDLFTQLRQAYLSGMFVFGVLMDKYFYTPMGHFLRLLRPVYPVHGSVAQDFRRLYSALRQKNELEPVLYMPAVSHCLTPVGAALLNASANRYHPADLPSGIDAAPIMADAEAWLSKGGRLLRAKTPAKITTDEDLYLITAAWEQNPTYCITLEVSARMPLSELHRHLAGAFLTDKDNTYNFFGGTSANPFIAYKSENPASGRNPAGVAFAAFCPADGRFLYTTSFQTDLHLPDAKGNSFGLAMRVTGMRKAVYGAAYPLVTQMSTALWEWREEAGK